LGFYDSAATVEIGVEIEKKEDELNKREERWKEEGGGENVVVMLVS
jgi:hypothetical protein